MIENHDYIHQYNEILMKLVTIYEEDSKIVFKLALGAQRKIFTPTAIAIKCHDGIAMAKD